jgi:hypothetical protein
MTHRSAWRWVVILVVGCVEGFSPPDGTTRLNPPPVYGDLWRAVESCSGWTGDIALVHWYLVPGERFSCNGAFCNGLWESPHNIYLSDVAAHDLDGDNYFTVRHEILHELVRQPGHPPVFSQCHLLRPGRTG